MWFCQHNFIYASKKLTTGRQKDRTYFIRTIPTTTGGAKLELHNLNSEIPMIDGFDNSVTW